MASRLADSGITAKVDRRGQIVIPKEIRQSLKLEEGQRVAFVWRGGAVVLLPLTERLADHKGSIAVEGPQDFDAIREQ
jgi:AbrB family looped-hinge helix DNA binding protein